MLDILNSGLSELGGTGGFNFGSLTGVGSTNTSSSGGGLGSLLAAAGSGAATGTVGGPIGAGIGAALSVITQLFNNHGVPDHERGDLNTIAATNDITADQASWVCGFEESHVKDNYDDICARAARDKSYFQQLVVKYNAAHPNEPVIPRGQQLAQQYAQLQSQAALKFGAASPLANLSLAAAQTAAAAQGVTLPDYLSARLTAASAPSAAATTDSATILGTLNGSLGTAAAGNANDPADAVTTDPTLLYVGGGIVVLLLVLLLVLAFRK